MKTNRPEAAMIEKEQAVTNLRKMTTENYRGLFVGREMTSQRGRKGDC